MRKILFVLVIALTAGCGGGGDDPIIPGPGSATYEQIIAALEDGAGKFDDATFGGSDNPYSETISWLKTQPGVQDAGLSDDGSTIWVKYTDGSTGTIITRPLTEGKIGQGINQSTFGNILENSLDLMTFRELAAIVGSKKALILEATDSTIPNDFPEFLYNELTAAGYEQIDIFKNEQVTPDILSNMGNYGVVFFCGHGDLYMSQVEWVTGETVTKDKKTYYETKYGNSIGLAFPSLEGVAKFTIRPAFINQIGGTFPESLVYATACQGLRNTSMAQAFVGKGAQVYIGWTNTVSVYATF